MNLKKRLQKVETSLTPLEAVLLWLKPMLDLGRQEYCEEMLADPRNPRVVVAKMVEEAVRENLSEPRLKPELLEQAVRDAIKQSDMLMVLVLDLHDHVRAKCAVNRIYCELLDERLTRIVGQTQYLGFVPKPWELWRGLLIEKLLGMLSLRGVAQSISANYYDGHPLLFAEDENDLNTQIQCLEELLKEGNRIGAGLPAWEPIDLQPLSSHIEESVEMNAKGLVMSARAKTLMTFREEQPARELLNSMTYWSLPEMKRLRALLSKKRESD